MNMFKRSGPPPPPSKLAERVRSLGEQRPEPVDRVRPKNVSNKRAERAALYRQGVLIFGDGQRLRIALKNLSTTGARVEFFTRTELPEEVILAEPTLKLRRRARVVWQAEGVAGLLFID